jgi:hypothetical protein
MALTESDRALIAAMELLRKQFAESSQALISSAANTKRSAADFEAQAAAGRDFIAGRKGLVAPGAEPEAQGGTKAPSPPPKATERGPARGFLDNREANRVAEKPALEGIRPSLGTEPNGDVQKTTVDRASLVNAFSAVAAKFAAVIAPVAILGRVLSASVAGFQLPGTYQAAPGDEMQEGTGQFNRRDILTNALQGTMQSLRQSISARPQLASIPEVGKQFQLTALKVDPIEERIERLAIRMVELMGQVVANTARADRPGRAYDPVLAPTVAELVRRTTAERGSTSDGADYGGI